MPAARRLAQRRIGVEIRALSLGEALLAFEHVATAGEAARRKRRGNQAILRRLAGMERLAHGAEHRFEPGRLRPGDAERGGGSCRVESEEMGARRRRAEAA